jgi:hypothetical protein
MQTLHRVLPSVSVVDLTHTFQAENDVVKVVVGEAIVTPISTTVEKRLDNHGSTIVPGVRHPIGRRETNGV